MWHLHLQQLGPHPRQPSQNHPLRPLRRRIRRLQHPTPLRVQNEPQNTNLDPGYERCPQRRTENRAEFGQNFEEQLHRSSQGQPKMMLLLIYLPGNNELMPYNSYYHDTSTTRT